jgi:hypothetical protein
VFKVTKIHKFWRRKDGCYVTLDLPSKYEGINNIVVKNKVGRKAGKEMMVCCVVTSCRVAGLSVQSSGVVR